MSHSFCRLRLTVRTPGFHPGNRGSIPLGGTIELSSIEMSEMSRAQLGHYNKIKKSDMYYVYVLFSLKDRKLYTGYTKNLKIRLNEHLEGKAESTKNRRPIKLIYYEVYENKSDAEKREKYLKGGNGRAQLKIQLKNCLTKYKYKYL